MGFFLLGGRGEGVDVVENVCAFGDAERGSVRWGQGGYITLGLGGWKGGKELGGVYLISANM